MYVCRIAATFAAPVPYNGSNIFKVIKSNRTVKIAARSDVNWSHIQKRSIQNWCCLCPITSDNAISKFVLICPSNIWTKQLATPVLCNSRQHLETDDIQMRMLNSRGFTSDLITHMENTLSRLNLSEVTAMGKNSR